jgi:hypothetical protein
MPVTHKLTKDFPETGHESPRKSTRSVGSKEAIAEIGAYIAIRDQLLEEAEEIATRAKIDSAEVANNFVMTCLRPARAAYQSQCLPEGDAERERKHCEAVNARLAELRARIIPTKCDRFAPGAR